MKMGGDKDIENSESLLIQIQHKIGESPISSSSETTAEGSSNTQINGGRSFVCKTCNKSFTSFQALGGHRTSHSKTKQMSRVLYKPLLEPKMHVCLICGAEFSLGQSLGGHMRKHRALLMNGALKHESSSSTSSSLEAVSVIHRREALDFDLNLMPSENEMKHSSMKC